MELRQGPVFDSAPIQEVEEYLRGRKLERYELPPEKLHIGLAGRDMTLRFCNGVPREYPVRRSFLVKLLKWYSFPLPQLRHLSMESILSIANDYLLGMKSPNIRVYIENEEALTLTGVHYRELADLEILRICPRMSLDAVSRNDFMMRILSRVQREAVPVPGDTCGFGFNVINSETGFRALSVQSYVLRYICSNGAVVPSLRSLSRRVHRGQVGGSMARFLTESIGRIAEEHGKTAEALAASGSAGAEVQRKLAERRLRKIIGRTETARIIRALPDSASRYDLFNLITAEAKVFDIEKRLQMETLAGGVLMGW